MFLIIVITVIYLFVIVLLGYKGMKDTKNAKDFMVGGRTIHPMVMALSYGATFISTSAIVGFGGASGALGMGLLWLTFLNIFVGIFIAFVIFGKRTRRMGHNLDSHTFPELLGTRFNSKFIQGFAGAVIFIFMPVYIAAVLKGGAEFITTKFNVSFDVALLFLVTIVAIYVWMGGMKGVMYTDAFQGLIMFAAMAFLLVFTYAKLGGVTQAHQSLTDLMSNPDVKVQTAKLAAGGFQGWTSMPRLGSPVWWNLVSTVVMGVGIGVLAQPQLVVRFMTVKSNRELNRAVASGGIFIFMMTGVAFLVGSLSNVIFFKDTGKIAAAAAGKTDSIIPEFIVRYLPEWFGAIFLVALLAAAMSTLSSQFHALGTAAGRDLYEKTFHRKGNPVTVVRVGILIGIIFSAGLAFLLKFLDKDMAIIATGTALFFGLCAATFLPAYVCALYVRKISPIAVKAGMITGFVSSVVWIFFIHEKESAALQLCKLLTGKTSLLKGSGLEMVDPIFIALPLAVIVTVVVGLLVKSNLDAAVVDKSFEGI
ncbi:MAG: sodium:solute symporter family protein [Saccharofermentanales bacterium]